MNPLLHNYNSYGNFLRDKFFAQRFNLIPSHYSLELYLDSKPEELQAILENLDLTTYNLELIFKVWRTSSSDDPTKKPDCPNQYFYCSNNEELCLWFIMEHGRLYMELLYNHENKVVEQWARNMCDEIKGRFGKPQAPTFKVLSKGGLEYYTEEINITQKELDVDKLYNDDFVPIDDIINESLAVDSSGLILLHGPPGTGKTSYIKYLLSRHGTLDFIFIPNDFVNELLQPGFISFLIANKNSILVIEDAEKVIVSRDNNSENSVVSTILQLTDGLFSDYLNIKIICTFNTSIDKVDKALLRKGRMIAYYEFKALAADKANALLSSLGHEPRYTDLTLAEVFNMDKQGFEAGRTKTIGFR
ncbi:MAG: AAA family ATPase [Bacteroidota bacterium]